MSKQYAGRHRPPTRAERRALEKRSRAPKSFGPGYALPTAAAATLVLSAAGATAAQSSAFGSVPPASAQAAFQAPEQASAQAAESSAVARTQFATQAADTSGLAERRKAVTSSVAQDQGRAQERQRVARDKKRKELAEERRKERAAAKRATTSPTTPGATGSPATASDGTEVPSSGSTASGPQSWVAPLDSMVFTSPYGPRWGRLHAGQDYSAPIGTPLRSMSSGTIVFAGSMQGYGTTVDIKYWDGTVSRYGHMNAINVAVGQKVGPGEVVGQSGNTGRSTGPHLHVEIHPGGGTPIDPGPWFAAKGIL